MRTIFCKVPQQVKTCFGTLQRALQQNTMTMTEGVMDYVKGSFMYMMYTLINFVDRFFFGEANLLLKISNFRNS